MVGKSIMNSFDVDIYLPFVDGDKEVYRTKMLAEAKRQNDYSHETSGLRRINNFGQLRLALRSIEYCAPWVRFVHLIFHRESHIPNWLDCDHPGIKIHLHREYFDSLIKLPTFSSFVIDTQMGRVPGLSDHFVYMEDDQFFCSKSSIEDFFSEHGRPIFHYLESKQGMKGCRKLIIYHLQSRSIWPHIYKYSNQIWKNALGIDDYRQLEHINDHRPYPFIKSIFELTHRTFPKIYQRSITEPFRRGNVLSFYAYLWGMVWNDLAGNAPEWRLLGCGILGDLPTPEDFSRYQSGNINDNTSYIDVDECQGSMEKEKIRILNLTNELFPKKSSFEID